jgi:succinate dehydrogenase / fumarate reductase cytochrome b subunit
MRARPLSPHLSIYRFMYTMALSIAHRIAGIALSVGLLLFAYWLMAASEGEAQYASAMSLLTTPYLKVLLAGWLLAFVYHLCNGIRHLTWDVGIGMEKHEARRSAVVALVVTVLMFALLAYLAFFSGSASSGSPS